MVKKYPIKVQKVSINYVTRIRKELYIIKIFLRKIFQINFNKL